MLGSSSSLLSLIASLVSLLSYRFLRHLLSEHLKKVIIGSPALTSSESLFSKSAEQQALERRVTSREKQKRALEDFFRDTGGKVTDLRVLRSAMFLSDEIDKAVRGIDDDDDNASTNQSSPSKHARSFVSWRPYNRFYAEGTEELFTNIPTGRSPLVMAAPSADRQTMLKDLDSEKKPLPIEYQAMRRSHLKLVGRQLKEFEQDQLENMSNNQNGNKNRQVETTQSIQQRYLRSDNKAPLIIPKNDKYEPSNTSSQDLRVGAYQSYQPLDKKTSVKKQLLKFEGDISERRPDLDYKFELE